MQEDENNYELKKVEVKKNAERKKKKERERM